MAYTYSTLSITGSFNYSTRVAFQKFLKKWGYYKGVIDGDFREMSWEGVQRWMRDIQTYLRAVDGAHGPYTWQGLRSSLRKYKLWYQSFPTTSAWSPQLAGALQRFLNSNNRSPGPVPKGH